MKAYMREENPKSNLESTWKKPGEMLPFQT